MPILNMTGGGASGPKIPLNDISTLSAEAGIKEATLKWADVGDLVVNGVTANSWNSTKLVRKVGSAPSNSSDGTLVTTETTLNQYQTNGYTDTGLTVGTTYYYKAFSVGSNGLESGSNSVSAVPTGWKPGANTIAYYPLNSTSTVNDISGNGYNLTANGNYTFDTLSVHFPTIGDNYLISSASAVSTITDGTTWQCWVKADDNSSKPCFGIMDNATGCGWNATWNEISGAYRIECLAGSYSYNTANGDGTTWHLYTVVLNNNVFTLYIDGSQAATANNGGVYSYTIYFKINKIWGMTNRGKARYSKFIIENKARTAQEISDYYNQTKGDYGL